MSENVKDILPSLSFVTEIYNQSKDIYDVLASLALFSLKKGDSQIFSREDAKNIINDFYGFSLPGEIASRSIKRLCENGLCTQLKRNQWRLSLSSVEEFKCLDNEFFDINKKYENLIIDISKFCTDELNLKDINTEDIKGLLYDFLSGVKHERKSYKDDIIELFTISNEGVSCTEYINTLKKGLVVYTGVCFTPHLDTIGKWNHNLYLVLSTDILFSAYGLNGQFEKARLEDFFELVKEVNLNKKKTISLIALEESQKEIDNFFYRAERITIEHLPIDVTKEAMVELLSTCNTAEQIIIKKTDFLRKLRQHGIEFQKRPENMNAYYLNSNEALAKIKKDFNEDVSEEDIQKSFDELSVINALRHGSTFTQFKDAKYFFVTGKRLTNFMAHHTSIRDNDRNIPLTANINFLTEKLWFALNKGFSNSTLPKSLDMIIRAKAAISSKLSDAIFEKYKELDKKVKDGSLCTEMASDLYKEYMSKKVKPENIDKYMTTELYAYLNENSIDKYIEEKNILKTKASYADELKNRIKHLYHDDVFESILPCKNRYRKEAKIKIYIMYLMFIFIIYISYYIGSRIQNTYAQSVYTNIVVPLICSSFLWMIRNKILTFIKNGIVKKYKNESKKIREKFRKKYSV